MSGEAGKDARTILDKAVGLHRAGQTEEAAALYRELLDRDPDNPSALNLLGVIALQKADAGTALGYLQRAAETAPERADVQVHLGEARRLRDEPGQALAAYHAALAIDPRNEMALGNIATVLSGLGRHREAADALSRLRRIRPDSAELMRRHGAALMRSGDREPAAAAFEDALANDPQDGAAAFNLGVARDALGDRDAAVAAYRRAVEINPEHVEALANLSELLRRLDRRAEAVALLDRALALRPNEVGLLNNRVLLLLDEGALDEAERVARAALEMDPDRPGTHTNLGMVLLERGRTREAVRHYRTAIDLDPDHADGHANLGLALLRRGEFEEGCREAEWRWRATTSNTPWRNFPCPVWRGEDLTGKTLLVWGEQGVGDEIMLASQIPRLTGMAGRLLIECESRLVPLFERSFPGIVPFPRARGAPPPTDDLLATDMDYAVPAMSVIAHLARAPDDLAPGGPHLTADPDHSAACRARYDALGRGLKIGISWHSIKKGGERRIADLETWRPILTLPGLTVIDLQYGNRRDERKAAARAFGIDIHWDDAIDSWASLDDFAAQVAALDLVVSIDNTTVHMAGALGVECWTLLPSNADWRWFTDRDDSPFYPSMRLFRQGDGNDWAELAARVAAVLKARLPDAAGR